VAKPTPATDQFGWADTGPRWTTKAFPPSRGQDHLGLGSVSSDRILTWLSPGINVLTIHPRYWSFYAFVLDEFWAADLPRNRSAFRDFYRPREALFAFACQMCDRAEHATVGGKIVGSQRTAGRALHDDQFDPSFNYIKEPLGGYGLYYRSAMELTELLTTADPARGFAWDALTPLGRGLADAYRQAVVDTDLYTDHYADLTRPVARSTLLDFAAHGCLCQLRASGAPDLPLLQDLFTHSGRPNQARSRRETLRVFLDLSQAKTADALDESTFRDLVYFRTLDGVIYTPRPDTAAMARRWRLYQAREYFSFAFNRLWAWTTRRGLQSSDGGLLSVPLEELWSVIETDLADSHFTEDSGVADPGIGPDNPAHEFSSWLTQQVDVSPGIDEAWPRNEVFDEHALHAWCSNTVDDPETLIAMVALLLLIFQRVGTAGRQADLGSDVDILIEGRSQRIGMAAFFAQLNKHLLAGDTLNELTKWILTNFVIAQHERVAASKLPEDTYRFRRNGDLIRFFDQVAPARFTDSRFNAISTMVHELGLVSSFAGPQRVLTKSGRKFLSTGDLPTGALEQAASPYAQQLT
jgi:hypothetical protein